MLHQRRLVESFGHAWNGLMLSVKENQNLRIHLVVAVVVAFLSFIFGLDEFEMAIVGVMILLVIAAEMINSSLEEMVDLIITEHHQQAKIAKDVAAGMVLVTTIGSIIVGLLIFVPHILRVALMK